MMTDFVKAEKSEGRTRVTILLLPGIAYVVHLFFFTVGIQEMVA